MVTELFLAMEGGEVAGLVRREHHDGWPRPVGCHGMLEGRDGQKTAHAGENKMPLDADGDRVH